MNDPLNRFSTRVENYAKYRPNYPAGVIDVLKSDCGLTENAVIADIGSGTGILSELFLRNGNSVFGVEPNAAMRMAGRRLLKTFGRFSSINATAEVTTLDSGSVGFITAAQAFHWFDREKATLEFARILKPEGYVVLIWNERRLDSTPFLRAYEKLLLSYGTDYEKVRHENVACEIAEFFAPETFKLRSLENSQTLNFEALRGRVCSSSYTPEAGSATFEPMMEKLQEIFDQHKSDETVIVEYDTRVYYGHLKPS